MSEAPLLPPLAEHVRPLASVLRLHNGLVDTVPGPDVLVTVTGDVDCSIDLAPLPSTVTTEARDQAVNDLGASLEVLHEVAQSVLGSLSAVAQAPRELETVVALSTHRITSITADLERQLATTSLEASARLEASAAAAHEVRRLVLADTAEDRDYFAQVALSLVERLEEADGRFLSQSELVMQKVTDNAVEAAELVHLATQQAVAEIAQQVKEVRSERRRGERALERVTERVLARMDELSARLEPVAVTAPVPTRRRRFGRS